MGFESTGRASSHVKSSRAGNIQQFCNKKLLSWQRPHSIQIGESEMLLQTEISEALLKGFRLSARC